MNLVQPPCKVAVTLRGLYHARMQTTSSLDRLTVALIAKAILDGAMSPSDLRVLDNAIQIRRGWDENPSD